MQSPRIINRAFAKARKGVRAQALNRGDFFAKADDDHNVGANHHLMKAVRQIIQRGNLSPTISQETAPSISFVLRWLFPNGPLCRSHGSQIESLVDWRRPFCFAGSRQQSRRPALPQPP